MGYYTKYNLEIKTNSITDIIYDLRHRIEDAKMAIDEIGDSYGDIKWHDHEKDMKEFSKIYPNCLFILKGEGKEGDDLWVKYFQNGKMQVATAKISYEDFDPAKLK